jgi:hypothetical protein
MRTRELPLRLMQTALILVTVMCVVAATPLAAQQAQDSARVSGTSAAPAVSPSAAQPGPRISEPQFQPYRPNLFPSNSNTAASAAGAAGEGGSHTIVLSTLALVLIVVIVVLLVVR